MKNLKNEEENTKKITPSIDKLEILQFFNDNLDNLKSLNKKKKFHKNGSNNSIDITKLNVYNKYFQDNLSNF